MLIDYHLHTHHSGDATGKVVDYILSASKKGLDEIGISDHFHPHEVKYSMTRKQINQYVTEVIQARENSKVPVKLGIELDFIPNMEEEIKKVTTVAEFDYKIGSVHYIKDWPFDNHQYISEYKKWDINQLYVTYFKLLQKCAKSKIFNIIGHPDLIKKFGYTPTGDMTAILNETAKTFKESDVCIEVNTKGLMMPCRELYPSKKFLQICLKNDVQVTLGSDAHTPEQVGRNFSQAISMLKEVGYSCITRFTKQKTETVEI